MAARGKCGRQPMTVGSKHAPKVKTDERGPYVEFKSVVRSSSSAVALMRIRQCPHALAQQQMNVLRIARRVHGNIRTFAEEAPDASAALVGWVELAMREIDHIHAVERREANPNG